MRTTVVSGCRYVDTCFSTRVCTHVLVYMYLGHGCTISSTRKRTFLGGHLAGFLRGDLG